jgi:anti-sigma B factor antagonist
MSAAEASEQLGYRLEGGVAVVEVRGDIDVSTCSSLRDRLFAVANEGHHGLVVKLDNVDFVDSTGIGVLVALWHRVQVDQGVLALAAPTSQARSLFHIAGVTKIFPIYDTEAEAVQACDHASSPAPPDVT